MFFRRHRTEVVSNNKISLEARRSKKKKGWTGTIAMKAVKMTKWENASISFPLGHLFLAMDRKEKEEGLDTIDETRENYREWWRKTMEKQVKWKWGRRKTKKGCEWPWEGFKTNKKSKNWVSGKKRDGEEKRRASILETAFKVLRRRWRKRSPDTKSVIEALFLPKAVKREKERLFVFKSPKETNNKRL